MNYATTIDIYENTMKFLDPFHTFFEDPIEIMSVEDITDYSEINLEYPFTE